MFVSENLNAEAAQQINFTVTASDSDPVAPMSNSITATITVTDVNDNTPSCSSQLYIESIGSSAAAGTNIISLQDFCSDNDIVFSQLSYSLAQNSSSFSISSTGELTVAGSLTPGSTTALSVVVSDNGSPSRSTVVTVSVQVQFDNMETREKVRSLSGLSASVALKKPMELSNGVPSELLFTHNHRESSCRTRSE